jgi:hypothetical protein
MSVPACPIPIHHTKLMMSNAQATGMLFPQTPMPRRNKYEVAERKTRSSVNPIANPTNQLLGCGRVSTIDAT